MLWNYENFDSCFIDSLNYTLITITKNTFIYFILIKYIYDTLFFYEESNRTKYEVFIKVK